MVGVVDDGEIQPPSADISSSYLPATRAIHADDHLSRSADVAPPMHMSTTYHYAQDPNDLQPVSEWDVSEQAFKDQTKAPTDAHIYSRLSAPTTTRLEALLSSLLHARALTYTSGLSAFHALLVHLNPRRIAIGAGYHGCHGVINIMTKLTGVKKVDLHGSDAAWDAAGLGTGDIVHVETPLNPTGEAYDLSRYAARAHARGAFLTVDSTFGPPGLQDPFAHGADAVMHSGTKYIGGHSDMLCGVLAVKRDDWWWNLYKERLHLGAVMGNMEGWLGIRSLRTLELRVQRQSQNADLLVKWLHAAMQDNESNDGDVNLTQQQSSMERRGNEVNGNFSSDRPSSKEARAVRRAVAGLTHASLQASSAPWLRKQMPNGHGPVFAILLQTREMAKTFPSKLQLFQHATSLGGVESLIEWRRMSDDGVDERLLRVSVGIEDVKDLWHDIVQGLEQVADMS